MLAAVLLVRAHPPQPDVPRLRSVDTFATCLAPTTRRRARRRPPRPHPPATTRCSPTARTAVRRIRLLEIRVYFSSPK
eukprot:1086879-Pyramimonas_sp.AAC.1